MTHPRKILVLLSSLGGGGAERVAAHLCNAWSAAGIRVSLMPTFPNDATEGYSLDSEVQVITPAAVKRKTAWRQLQRLQALRTTIKSEQPDYVVTFLTNVNVAGIVASLGLGVRVIVCERIFPPLFPVGRTLSALRWLTYPLAYRVLVQTRTTQQWFQTHLPRARTAVIPNPLVLPLADTQPTLPVETIVAPNSKLILAVGRLDAQKGFMDLLQAFALLNEAAAHWQLVVLGEGNQRHSLNRLIAELGLGDRVQLPGRAGNIAQWYERAELFVLSSHFEGFPNALLEAMGHGIACVAYDCPAGPADIIEDGHSGRLVALDSRAAGLADAIQQLMTDEHARQTMAANARTAAERFADHRVLALWSELLAFA